MSETLIQPEVQKTPDPIQRERWERIIEEMEDIAPLWYYHAARMKLTPQNTWCNTAAVDGTHLFYNDKFTASLTDPQLRFLLIHEVFHVAMGHLWRSAPYIQGKDRIKQIFNSKRWGRAADYAIHQVMVPLVENGYFKEFDLPRVPGTNEFNGLYDPKYENLSAEQIFDLLTEEAQNSASGGIHTLMGTSGDLDGEVPDGASVDSDGNWVLIVDENGNPITPDPNDPNAPTPKDVRELQDIIAQELKNLQGSTSQGNSPGGELRVAEDYDPRQAKSDWRNILANWMIQQARSDYSYRKPNRGYLVRQNLLVPGLLSEKLHGAIVIDTSGSISDSTLTMFMGQIEAIRAQIPDHVLEIVCADAAVQLVQRVESGTPLEKKTKGGGGTNFIPALKHLEEMAETCHFCLYFTDGYGTCPKNPPSYPVMWCLFSSDGSSPKEQPWGENFKIPT
jgi:predicted metal-dependent peptidase